MQIIDKKLTDLKPYANNPRHNAKAVPAVKESILKFGFKVPLVIDKNNVIVCGHTRFYASKEIGLETVPCIVADDLTDEQINAFRLVDNRVSEFADWNFDKLAEELSELQDFDFEPFAFDDLMAGLELDYNLNQKDKEAVEDDYDAEPPAEPKTKYGDIYQLGNHFLMCGDSTKEEDVEKLMDGVKADMVFTDPPYGMKKEKEGVLNDNLNYEDLLEFNKKWIPLTFKFTKENGSWYCWGIDEPLMDIYSEILKPMIKQNKITFRNLITWNKFHKQKPTAIEMMRSYCIYDEKCLFVMCGVQGFNNNTDNYYEGWEPIRNYLETEAKKVELTASKLKKICGVGMYSHWFTKSQFCLIPEEHYKKIQEYYKEEAFKKDYEELKKDYYKTRAYFNNTHETYMTEVWDFETTNEKERENTGGHATPKPIELCARAIKSSSRENEMVLDVFGGSGSTLIACEQLNRKCYMMEISPIYCDVIIDRWEKFTGKKAEKINE